MRALRLALWAMGTCLIAFAVALAALWFWSGANTSLSTALAVAAQWLPVGQTLQTRNVQGSVQGGGTVEWLRWQQGDLSVEVHDLQVHWSWRRLLDGEARVDQLAARLVHIEDHRASTPQNPPPTNLVLPIKVDAQVAIAALEWQGTTLLTATDLSGHYVFDSASHRLDAGRGRISSGNYQFNASLQAQAPMALAAKLQGTVQTTLPGQKTPWEIPATASANGTLAGADATLDLQAALKPANGKTAERMQAQLTARVQPWQAQPVVQAHATWQGLDLATLWPQAPQTLLSGEASVTPAGSDWHATIQARNTQSGPWNQRRLPLERLDARLDYAQDQWVVRALQAAGAGGTLEAQGQVSAHNPGAGWQGQAKMSGVNTAALDSRLASNVLDGQLTAQQSNAGIAFKAEVSGVVARNAQPAAAGGKGVRLQQLTAAGVWKAPLLKIDSLTVQTDDATLNGQLSVQTTDYATSGDVALHLPGVNASAKGQLGSKQGDGKLNIQITDAALLNRWLARLPGVPVLLATQQIKGTATLDASWQGGWHDKGRALEIRATGRVPQWDGSSGGATATTSVPTPWRVRDGQLDLSGTLAALSIRTQGQLERDTQRLTMQARAVLGQVNDSTWRLQLDTLQATAQDSRRAGVWALTLADRVTWTYQQTATSRALESTPGTLRLVGPSPGTALLTWQSARWAQASTAGTTGPPHMQWNTQGRLSDLPVAWLEAFSPTSLAQLGLRGNVMLGGQWEVQNNGTLQVRAHLERTAGDLQLLADDSSLLIAGIRTARLDVANEGEQLSATLRWDSEQAGQMQANVSTRLQRIDDNWVWPADAPLAGQIKAQLPRVGAWSMLAPPGWRMRGTLDADVTLAGTRKQPLWRGRLGATDLALRSVVDGIDFSGGTLRTRLDGERLDIEEFTLQGAGGSSGGLLTATGFVQWGAPEASPGKEASFVERLRLEMDATAKALRVTARSDRRLVVSGNLSARLAAAKLAIRGTLKADQALFVMPEDSTPRLGDDVVVRKPAAATPVAAPRVASATPSNAVQIQPDLVVTLDLGSDFQVRGSGLTTLLEGSLELRNAGRTLAPRLSGTLRTAQGTYKAYGQQLDIEEGVLRFTGPYNNPSLDILAIRPNLTQRVGVQISGTALSPVVRLYADPDLSESEKLSWLVLGRSGANGGAETAMLQQAALALLGNKAGASGGIADALGLDEISVRGAGDADTTTASGNTTTTGATGATVTLGKRISRDFYVAYERSMASTVGTLSIFYDLSRRFTLRGQTGEQSAIDLIFTLRYE